ncbi:MAG: Spore protein SP21 [Mycoplasmataceae bacterium]|nr:MAG: Spore protein SP21 [Mycoplasmataceae bacterium]
MNRENLIRNRRDFNPFRRSFFDDLFFPLESTLFPEINNALTLKSFNSEFKEDKDSYYIKAELPGINKDDIDIDIDNNKISIHAEKKEEKELNDKKHHHFSEIYYGSFSRTYSFSSPVDVECVKAVSKNGILHLTIPKLARSEKSTKINIE